MRSCCAPVPVSSARRRWSPAGAGRLADGELGAQASEPERTRDVRHGRGIRLRHPPRLSRDYAPWVPSMDKRTPNGSDRRFSRPRGETDREVPDMATAFRRSGSW